MVSFELLRNSEMISNSIVTFVYCPRVFPIYRRLLSLPVNPVDYSPRLLIPTVFFNL